MRLTKWGVAIVMASVGCSLVTSLDGLGPDLPTKTDASVVDGAGSSDAIADVQVVPDVPVPASCSGGSFKCVTAAPAGWSGPFALYTGAPSSAPSCPGDAPLAEVSGNAGLGAVPQAQCSACACTASAISCGKSTVTPYANTGCTGACGVGPITVSSGACSRAYCNGVSEAVSVYVTAPSLSATCTPQAPKPTPTLPALTFATRSLGCRAPTLAQVDCKSGEVCATLAGSPFQTGLCIAQNGDVACPAGPYSVKKPLTYRDVTDTRDCGACACGSATGSCTATATPYADIGCGSAQQAPVTLPACVPHGSKFKMVATAPGTATCPASGGAPTGTAVLASPVTVCCAP